MIKIAVFCLIVLVSTAGSATYYVDYDNGNDTRAGTSAQTAWQHSPADPAALGNAAVTTLAGGDMVLFKSDVIYRGCIRFPASGATGNPITYKGNGWGTGRAVMDGSELITTSWTKCASAADCGGNPHWQNIYYTDLPDSISTIFTPIYENDQFMWVSQDPNPGDFFHFDRIEYFYPLPLADQTAFFGTAHFVEMAI